MPEGERMKTSLELPVELWRRLKVYAAEKGLKLMKVVEDALRDFIEEEGEGLEKRLADLTAKVEDLATKVDALCKKLEEEKK